MSGAICFLLAACSFTSSSNRSSGSEEINALTETGALLEAGSVVIAKRLPPITEIEQMPLYGFLPLQPLDSHLGGISEETPAWAEVSLSEGSLKIYRGLLAVENLPISLTGPLTSSISNDSSSLPGIQGTQKAQVIAQELNPTWMAPDSYFVERDLPVPPEGDASRFLKGALGKRAVFLDNGLVLHSGPVFNECSSSPEGIRLSPEALEVVSPLLEAGTKVIFR